MDIITKNKRTLKPKLQRNQKKLEIKTDTDSVLEMHIINGKFEELDDKLNVLVEMCFNSL